MIVTDLKKEGIAQALKACRTLLLFQSTEIPLRLETDKDGLVLSASGGGSHVRVLVPGNVEGEGSAVIDLNHLLSLHLEGKTTTIKALKKQIEIRSGRGLYKITQSASESKRVSIPKPGDKTVELQAAHLRTAVKAVWFKHDDSGTGDLRLVFGKGVLRAETADEFRGVMYRRPFKEWDKIPLSKAILPKKSADAIISSFDPDDTLYIEVTSSSFRMYSDVAFVAIPLVTDSGLPNVASMLKEQVAQLKKTSQFQVGAGDLSRMTKAATSVIDKKDAEKLAAAHAYLVGQESRFQLRSSGDIGSFQTQVPAESFQGEPFKVCVLAKNLADLVELAKNTGESLSIEIWGTDLVMLRNVGGGYRSIYAFPQVQV